MGLDSVELLLEVEDAFGIDIPDEVATKMLTVKDMIDYIAEHVPTIPQEECHTQRIFYKLRRAFRDQIPVLATDFRLQSKLKNILRKDQWPKVWAAVREQVGEEYWPEKIDWPGHFFNQGPATVRELVYYVAFNLPKPNIKMRQPWTRERITLEVREIINDIISDVNFKQSANFARDLRIR